ncbi:hypothetical protein [Arcticibacterium luteifluviistationis]|uniref:DUF4468 domain-containing protein n=1 Tax=Arcticibacterium luteifluviistationis TaxID=1784714 RepID=A0A2Z4GEP9_9BACT|nr:hypothetical protein [Arcticibacterium luteifluviistationis]AWV99611.1 hypothetical protein DJ013_16105 [Arcticibacterium luteifluviistationis]
MTRLLTLSLFLLLSTANAQKTIDYVKMATNTEFYDGYVNTFLNTEIAKEYKLDSKSTVEIKPTMDYSKVYSIEGINLLYKGVVKVSFELGLRSSKKDTIVTYEIPVSASNKYQIVKDLILEMAEMGVVGMVLEELTVFSEKYSGLNCDVILTRYQDEVTIEGIMRLNEAISQTSDKSCKIKLEAAKEKILVEYGNKYCDENFNKLKVLSVSGVEFQMIKAVNILSKIPPNCKCSEEAITISKGIGEYFLKRSNKELNIKAKRINHFLLEGDYDSWSQLNNH